MPAILFFPFFGPNRRSDKRVVECRLDFSRDSEIEFPQRIPEIRQLLLDNGVLNEGEKFPEQAPPEDKISCYTSLLIQTALLFQRKNGQSVGFFSVSCEPDRQRCIALMEHEHSEVGMAAAKLAIEVFTRKPISFPQAYLSFRELAREHFLPLETQAIINCARQRDIPVLQLDRAPLIGCMNFAFRIRPNGLLSIGHGAGSHILDGTFCLDQAGDFLKAMIRNPGQRMALLKQLGIPLIQPNRQQSAANTTFYLLVVNKKLTAIAEVAGVGKQIVKDVHGSLINQTLSISEKLGFVPVAVMYQATDIAHPLADTGGAAVDFDLAPDLYELLGQCAHGETSLESVVGDLLDALFSDQNSARIPMVAVTGTNGKTTTSRMIRHIFQHSGFKPGLVCTDGTFFDQTQVSRDDNGTFAGHARVLTSQQVNAAVLETHHRGITVHGFAFQHCDVCVCLNVTEEHLVPGEIETVEEMASIKRALVERASHAAILFADDAFCLQMIDFMKSREICLVSMQSSIDDLSEAAGQTGSKLSFCVLESIKDVDWIVLYIDRQRLPVMPVAAIPATFDGAASFNVSNAMHAISASYHSGLAIDSISKAMTTFSAGQQFTPGRLNVFDELPFRVIMDFAHTPDGVHQICKFADRQNPSGRKVIAFCGSSKRSDDHNRKIAREIAGHFDFYICKDYAPKEFPRQSYTGPFMQKTLLEEGVPEHLTTVVTYGRDVIFGILESCKPGDLLILLVGYVEKERVPVYLKAYKDWKSGGNGSGHSKGLIQ